MIIQNRLLKNKQRLLKKMKRTLTQLCINKK